MHEQTDKPCRCWATSQMQIYHAHSEHGSSGSHALQQQMRHATQPLSMYRSKRNALPRAAHSSMQVVCTASRLSGKLTSQEWRHHRQSERWQGGRDAAAVAHAASSSSRDFDSPSNTRAPSPLSKFVQDQYLPLALLTGMIVG